MPRKYTRYGFNRQYRRNPSRKRNPFPYRLPFVPDYRTNPFNDPDAGVPAATASRYRTVIADLLSSAQFRNQPQKRKYSAASQDAVIMGGAAAKTFGFLAKERYKRFKYEMAKNWGKRIAVGSRYGGRIVTVAELLAL